MCGIAHKGKSTVSFEIAISYQTFQRSHSIDAAKLCEVNINKIEQQKQQQFHMYDWHY